MIENLLLRALRAETQVLRSEIDVLRAGGGEEPWHLLADAPVLIAHCREYPVRLRGWWESHEKGSEGAAQSVIEIAPFFTLLPSLTEMCQETIAAVRQALQEAEPGRVHWEKEMRRIFPVVDLAPLDVAVEELRALRAEVSGLWERLNAPSPPRRPLPTRAEVEAALEAGESIDIEDIIAEIDALPPEAS